MSRYIDAGQIVYQWVVHPDGTEHDGVTLQSIVDLVPTADVVEVVRCKDCRHWKANHKKVYHCNKFGYMFGINDFCSYGERND